MIDRLGHDPRSAYAELFWLPILGPTTTWLLRRIALGLDEQPDGFDLPVCETAEGLGLGGEGGRHSPFMRSLRRACTFKLAAAADERYHVRRRLPPLTRVQVERLPAHLRCQHESWQRRGVRRADEEALATKARRLALTLFELGEDFAATERQLHLWKFHPEMSREATAWAHGRHARAAASVRQLE